MSSIKDQSTLVNLGKKIKILVQGKNLSQDSFVLEGFLPADILLHKFPRFLSPWFPLAICSGENINQDEKPKTGQVEVPHLCDYHLLRHQHGESCKIHVKGKGKGKGVDKRKEKEEMSKKILFNCIRIT